MEDAVIPMHSRTFILHTSEEDPRLMNAMKFILLSVLALIGGSCTGDVEKNEHVIELRKFASQTPLYPGFQNTGEKIVLKSTMVYLNAYFKSEAQFSDVKKFYDRVLAERGWGPPQQPGPTNSVSYRQGDYVIVVEQDESRRDNFDIVFEWDPE